MDTIANMMRTLLSRSAVPQQPALPTPPAVAPALDAVTPIAGRLRYRDLPKHFALSPEESAASMAWERGDTNRAELERAMRAERRPHVRALLQAEHDALFGGGR